MSTIPVTATILSTFPEFTSNTQIVANPDATSNIKYIVTGDGIFDKLMQVGSIHLDSLVKNYSLKTDAIPALHMRIYEMSLQTAMQMWLQKPISIAQTASEEAKKALYERQAKGFDDDAKIKVLNISLQSWALAFSVAKDNPSLTIPDPITNTEITELTNSILSNLP